MMMIAATPHRLPSIESIFTAIIFLRKQGGKYVIQENQILSVLSHVSNVAGFFWVTIYLEYNRGDGGALGHMQFWELRCISEAGIPRLESK